MTQLDIFENPIVKARRGYPFVTVLQSDLADTGRDRIVAPLAVLARGARAPGRLTPRVEIAGTTYLVMVPSITSVSADELTHHHGTLARYRDALVAALDYLFLGV